MNWALIRNNLITCIRYCLVPTFSQVYVAWLDETLGGVFEANENVYLQILSMQKVGYDEKRRVSDDQIPSQNNPLPEEEFDYAFSITGQRILTIELLFTSDVQNLGLANAFEMSEQVQAKLVEPESLKKLAEAGLGFKSFGVTTNQSFERDQRMFSATKLEIEFNAAYQAVAYGVQRIEKVVIPIDYPNDDNPIIVEAP